jgi:uroporphyrinogen decarboxylase
MLDPTATTPRRDRIRRLLARDPAGSHGFWLGQPHAQTWPALLHHFAAASEEEVRQQLGDDVRWICPQFYADAYRDPAGRLLFDAGLDRTRHGQAGPLAGCETVAGVERHPWPNPDYLDFSACLRDLRAAGDVYRLSGFWCCFFHNVADLFGMEEYFVKMHTHPAVVHAAIERVCAFYHEANERFFAAAAGGVDGFFFGNDFGCQRGLILSPHDLDTFVFPWFRRFAAQGHRHGCQVVVHSCGSVHPLIERMIDAGVDALHPLQARARDMDAARLAADFRGRIAFVGGIDAQHLLTRGTPDQIRAEVRRVRRLLGPHLIVSPSHEAILPDVPMANIQALAAAAAEPD